jgi:hypothetical protein
MPALEFLFNIFTPKEKQISRFSSFTDPYSSNLAYFFKKVAPVDPGQLKLLQEYSKYKELRNFIEIEKKANGDVTALKVKDQTGYEEAKSELAEHSS